jgi:hypothetical protein
MRAGLISLVLSGLVASTSAVGFVLYNSQQELGPDEVGAEVEGQASAGEISNVETFSDRPLATVASAEDFRDVVHTIDIAPSARRIPVSAYAAPTAEPLPVDTGFTHVQVAAGGGTNTTSDSYASSSSMGAMASSLSMRAGGASASKSFRPGPEGTGGRPDPGPVVGPNPLPPTVLLPPVTPPKINDPIKPDPGPPDPPFVPDLEEHTDPVTVPEPGTLGLLALGAAGLLFGRRKPRAQKQG